MITRKADVAYRIINGEIKSKYVSIKDADWKILLRRKKEQKVEEIFKEITKRLKLIK